jgi:hypothetical protein
VIAVLICIVGIASDPSLSAKQTEFARECAHGAFGIPVMITTTNGDYNSDKPTQFRNKMVCLKFDAIQKFETKDTYWNVE